MAIIVQKFGGSSVADTEKIQGRGVVSAVSERHVDRRNLVSASVVNYPLQRAFDSAECAIPVVV